MDDEALLSGLDEDQIRAVTADVSPLAIVAAAGSGKTTVLTRRIARRVLTDPDVHANHVLALTFTNQAAHELQWRLHRLGLRDRVEAGTFHAVALRLLRQRATDMGHHPPSVANDRRRLMHEAMRVVDEPGRRTSGGTRGRTRMPPIGPDDETSALLAEIDWHRARREPLETTPASVARRRVLVDPARLRAVAGAYADVKRRRGVVDFDDLLESALDAMRREPLWAEGVRWRYRHLFVDEAQDLNPLQHALLEALRGDRADLCLVGDPRQAIFGFNGADPTIMTNVERHYPGITIVRLETNYRCTPQILGAARRVLRNAAQADESRAAATDGPSVVVRAAADVADEQRVVASLIRDAVGGQRPWRTCAVLARTVAQLQATSSALQAAGIPVEIRGRASNPRALRAAIAEASTRRHPGDLAEWIESVSNDDTADPVRARVAEAADRFLAQGVGITFASWIELHAPFDDLDDAESEDAVELLTFHGAKGREWPTVIIIGAEAGLIPHASAVTAEQRAEEARLLYVAMTRGRERVMITHAASRADRPSAPSPLIADITDDEAADAPPPLEMPRRAAPVDPVLTALVEWRRNAARAAQVDPASICSDAALRAIANERPTTVERVGALARLGPLAAARVAPRILDALNRAAQRG